MLKNMLKVRERSTSDQTKRPSISAGQIIFHAPGLLCPEEGTDSNLRGPQRHVALLMALASFPMGKRRAQVGQN